MTNMKKILFAVICMCLVGCLDDKNELNKLPERLTPQYYFDNHIKKSEIIDKDGHMYYLYEVGDRGFRNYAFDLEHRLDCKVCLDKFD